MKLSFINIMGITLAVTVFFALLFTLCKSEEPTYEPPNLFTGGTTYSTGGTATHGTDTNLTHATQDTTDTSDTNTTNDTTDTQHSTTDTNGGSGALNIDHANVDLVITEIMYAADINCTGEYIEVYNASGEAVNLNGLVLDDLLDAGGEPIQIETDYELSADEYVVIGSGTWTPGPDIDITLPALNNTGDDVFLYRSDGSTVLDSLTYPDIASANGYAIELDPTKISTTENDEAANWAEAVNDTIIDCGGAGTGVGTPGQANTGAPSCTDGLTNQDETDIDCGGTTCSACADGKSCSINSDCTSNNCDAGTCAASPGPSILSTDPASLSFSAGSAPTGFEVTFTEEVQGLDAAALSSSTCSSVGVTATSASVYDITFDAVADDSSCDIVFTKSAITAVSGGAEMFGNNTFTVSVAAASAPVIWQESFETDGLSTRYTTNSAPFDDGVGDFWNRWESGGASNPSGLTSFSNFDGSWFWAGEDLDGEGASLPVTLEFSSIDISGKTDLVFKGLFAADNVNSKFDAVDYVDIKYSIDGGAEVDLLWFRNDGSTYNTDIYIDSDKDGVGDGAMVTTTFSEFSASIPDTGSGLVIKFYLSVEAGDEEFAFDNLRIEGN